MTSHAERIKGTAQRRLCSRVRVAATWIGLVFRLALAQAAASYPTQRLAPFWGYIQQTGRWITSNTALIATILELHAHSSLISFLLQPWDHACNTNDIFGSPTTYANRLSYSTAYTNCCRVACIMTIAGHVLLRNGLSIYVCESRWCRCDACCLCWYVYPCVLGEKLQKGTF